MNLKELKARGALVLSPPIPADVTWVPRVPPPGVEEGTPVTFTVHIRIPSAGWLDRARTAAARNGAISYRSAIISHAVIFGDDQDEALSYEEADVLDDPLADALMAAYNRVNFPVPPPANGEDKREAFAKNTEPMPGSGTNSSEQASADEPLTPPAGQ
jgi:hypothetical protein